MGMLRQRKLLWMAARIAISVVLLIVIIRKANPHTFVRVLEHSDPLLVALGLGIGLVTIVLSSWQWKLLLKQQNLELSLAMATGLYFVGLAFGQLLPTSIGGDVAKAAYVARLSHQGVRATSATVMARAIGLLALFLTALPVALVAALVVPGLGWHLALILFTLFGAYAGLLALVLNSPVIMRRYGGHWLDHSRVGRKALDLATSCAAYRLHARLTISALLVSLVFYAASNSNFYAYGLALHVGAPFWFYWIAIPITAIVTMLPISINGYGVRGASFAAVFALMGVPTAVAISLALAMELQMVVFALGGGVVALVLNRRLAQQTPVVATSPAPTWRPS